MKKILTLFVAVTAIAVGLHAQTIVIDDGFENGLQDSVWTQEYVVGNHAWVVEDVSEGLTYPATVVQGTKRLSLRNNTGETEGYVTRLVSKVMDLSQVYQPFLSFYYANPKWTTDRDTLRVYYRNAATAEWTLLEEFSDANAGWKKVSINLPRYNATYQVAIEGKDNLGRGIVLDSVKLRSAPECTVPHDLYIIPRGNGKATLGWQASWDAENFELVVAKEEIDIDTLQNVPDSLLALKTTVSGLTHTTDVELTSGAYFYAFVRSLCEAEVSDWSQMFKFRMKATKSLPYFYDFNMDYNAGHISRDLEWTWGGNTGNYNPFIATHLNETELKNYSKDGTAHVVFSGANNSTTAIPAGKYAYVATPGLSDNTVTDFNLKDCQVHFWSTVHAYTGAYAHSIIVGVMTDPEDITTFVAVDTVGVWGYATFQENIVSLASYEGEGQYVAFLSQFDKKNLFYLDDVTIERRPQVNTVTKVVVNPRDTFATISWETTGAGKYTVLVADVDVDDPENIKAANIIEKAEVTTTTYTCTKLEADHNLSNPYYVYIKADTADWSYRKPFTTLRRQALPAKFDMEQQSGCYYINGVATTMYPNGIGIYTNDAQYPYLYTSNFHSGASCLYLSKDKGNDSWITFPLSDLPIQQQQITFYLSGNTTPTQVHATVGVMSNPYDLSTFDSIADYTLSSQGYYRCYTNFKTYTGTGDVIAIRWTDLDGKTSNTNNYIDDVVIEELGSCLPPSDVKIEPTDTSIVISWPVSDITRWQLLVATAQVGESALDGDLSKIKSAIKIDTLQMEDPSAAPTFTVTGLEWGTSYFFYLRALCDEETMSWWNEFNTKTACPEHFATPYTEGFEKCDGEDLGCWQGYDALGTGYPKAMTSYPYKGNSHIELWSTSTTHRSWIVAPGMDTELKDLLVDFYARSYASTTASVVYAGTTNTPGEIKSIQVLDTFYIADGAKYYHYAIDLSNYTNLGQYFVLTSGIADTLEMNSDVYIDEVRFQKAMCATPYNIYAKEATQTSVKVAWDGKCSEKWQFVATDVLVSASDSIFEQLDAKHIIKRDSVDAAVKEYTISDLKMYTKYYIYIRPTCGLKEWATDSVMTECFTIKPGDPKETFEQYDQASTSYNVNAVPQCWIGGNAGPYISTSYLPYVYKSSTYAHNSTNSLRVYGSYSSVSLASCANPAWVATPEIDVVDMSKVAVNFYVYASSSYYCVYGVMTDPEDISTFVTLDSVKGTGSSTLVTVDLADYKDSLGTAKHFAWRTQNNKTCYFYLDDISIISGSCPIAKPVTSELTSTSIKISSGIRTENDWWVLLTDKQIPIDSLEVRRPAAGDTVYVIQPKDTAKIGFYEKVSAKSKTFTNLNPQTDYYVYVQCDCDTVYGAWVEKTFTTPCSPVAPEDLGTIYFSTKDGYTTGSTGLMPCWTKGNKSGASASYIPYVTNTTTYKYNGNNYLYFYSYASSTYAYDGGYAIMPCLNVDDVSKYQVSFYGRGYNATTATALAYGKSIIVGIVTDPSDLNTFVALDTVEGSNTAYEAFTVTFDEYKGDYMGNKGKYVMFLSEFGKTNYFYLTGITVSAIPSCRPSYDFVVDSVAEEAAVFSWKGYTDSCRLKLATENIDEAKKLTYTDWVADTLCTSFDSVLITGLDGGTLYYAYVQSLCEDTAVYQMGSVQFRTECPVDKGYKIPYYNDFDKSTQTGSGNRPDCWEGFQWDLLTDTIYSLTYPYVGTTASYSYDKKGYYLYMSSTKNGSAHYCCYAIAPKVNGDLNELMVSFQMRKASATKTSYGKTLRVGYVTDWSSNKQIHKTFVKLADVDAEEATTDYVFCSVNMAELNAKIPAGARIALYADPTISSNVTATSGYGTFYIDNFKIGTPPSCYAPTLEAGNTTLTTADVKIIPAREGNSEWELGVITKEVYDRNSTNVVDILNNPDSTKWVVANDTNFTITGLENSTIYEIFARTVCGGEDGKSDWSGVPIEMITKFYYKDTYTFGFEKSEGWILSKYSSSDSYYIHPAIETGIYVGTITNSSSYNANMFGEASPAPTSYSYYPYAYESTSTAIYHYGDKNQADNIAALRFYGSTSYYGSYAIFPAVDSAQTRSFEFKVRQGYLSASTMKVSLTYSCELEIGLVDKNQGFNDSTYQILATIDLPVLDKNTVASATNDWFFKSISVDLDSATVANKQVVLRLPTKGSSYVYVDNVTMGAAKGYGLVSLNDVHPTSSAAEISWSAIGGPWNLTVYNTDAEGKQSTVKASYTNLTTTSQLVEGLDPQTTYVVKLEAVNAPQTTDYVVSSTKTFTTPCLALEPDKDGAFVWDFNDPTEWEHSNLVSGTAVTDTAYYKPECFTMGSTSTSATTYPYYNWLIQRKGYTYTGAPTTLGKTATSTAHYEYGRDDSPALKVYNSSTTYMTPYVVLPELGCKFDTMMIEFWGRCLANYDATYGTASSRNKMISASYCGGSYSQKLVVGTLTDPNDFSTLEVIDTVTYTAYTSTTAVLVTTDPAGERYWQKFQLPLGSAKGKYIVLFQAGYGLFFVDDLAVKPVGTNIFAPSNGKVVNFGTDTVELTWQVKHPTFQTVIKLMDKENQVLKSDTVTGTSHVIRNLTPGEQYNWSFYQINGENKSSEVQGESFILECLAFNPNGYTNGFELNDGWTIIPGQTSLTYKQNKCWVYGNAGTSAWTTSCAYNYPASSTISYAHSGEYGIKLYAYSTSSISYVAMPAVEDVAAYDTLQVDFWLRAGYHNPGTGKISYQYTTGSTAISADYYYARSVIVGTMTDPNDGSTFVPIDTVTYSRKLVKNEDATAANDFLFEKASISLRGAEGKYIAFMATLYAKGEKRQSTYDYIFLDDISFSKLQECTAPTNLKATDIESDGATLSWTGCDLSEKFVIEVSTDPTFEDETKVVYKDTIDTTVVQVSDLDKYTQYVWHVSSLCTGEQESDYSANSAFTTLRSPYYLEDFREATLDAEWKFGTTPIANVMDDSIHAEITGDNSATYGFKRVTTNVGMIGAHYCVPFYSSSSTTVTTYDYYWMISPTLALDSVDKAIFTMDMALTKATYGYSPVDEPALAEYIADDFAFVVAISEDAGQTWNKANIKAAFVGQDLLTLNTAQTMRIDLSQYKGKKVNIGLYREAQTYMSTGAALHFSNIRVNYFDSLAVDTTACQFTDIEAFGFKIDGDEVEPGLHVFNRLQLAGESEAKELGYRDTLYNLTAEYYAVPETMVADTICEGETYTGYDFTGKSRTGVYRRKLSAVNTCDSIVTLSLQVITRRYAETEVDQFCKGDIYTWQGKIISRQGLYYDTLVSSVGCDSIVSLNLQYYTDEDTVKEESTIYVEDLPFTYNKYEYVIGQDPISYAEGTKPGVYVDTAYIKGVNCSAVLIHTLTIIQTTGVDDANALEGDDDGKFIYDNHLYIRKNKEIYDAVGRKAELRK